MYKKLNKERVAYCDCDDTLLLWDYYKYPHKEEELLDFSDQYGEWKLLPHKKNIEFLVNLKRQGYGVVIWSAAGSEWAERVTIALGLQEVADFVMAKPEVTMDDLLDATRIIKSVVWIDPTTGEYRRNSK